MVVLSADSGGSSGFGEFARTHPERYFEFGIMEQGVTGIAAGLATTGLIPVFAAIAPFVTSRNFEMFRNDLGYMRQNVKIVGRNGGFTYADLYSTILFIHTDTKERVELCTLLKLPKFCCWAACWCRAVFPQLLPRFTVRRKKAG